MGNTHFLFIHDFFRRDAVATAPFALKSRWRAFTKTLFHLCRVPLKGAVGKDPTLLCPERAEADTNLFYSDKFSSTPPYDDMAWASLYWQEPDSAAISVAQNLCADKTVVGYDLSPFCRKALSAAGIQWLNISVHPVRFLDDLLFGWETNIPSVAPLLYEKHLNFQLIELAAARLQARYALNYESPAYRFPENALVIIPQELGDPLPVSHSGRLCTFSDHASELLELASKHTKVFLYTGGNTPPNWSPLCKNDKQFLTKDLQAVVLPDFSYQMDNLYMLMASPFSPTFAALNSKSLYEAKLFAAATKNFAPSPNSYAQDQAHTDNPMQYSWALDKSCFDMPFWKHLCACMLTSASAGAPLPADAPLLPADAQAPQINARLMFRNGGSDFDDADSFSQCVRLASDKATLTGITRNAIFEGIIATYKEQPKNEPRKRAESITQKTKDYAIFSTGCEKLVAPFIAALESIRKYSGWADGFYITEAAQMPEKKKELLHHYGVQLIDSSVDESLQAPYPVGTAHAYLYLKGPEILHAMGYRYSVATHADMLCLRPFDIGEIFERTNHFSSCNGWPYPAMTIENRGPANALAETALPWWNKNMNPGVIFNNNAALKEFGLWDKAMSLYSAVGPQSLPLNEESLYSLLVMLHPQINRLEKNLHFMMVHDKGYPALFPHFIHFSGKFKPWHFSGTDLEFTEKRHKLWHVVAADVLGNDAYYELFQAAHNKAPDQLQR